MGGIGHLGRSKCLKLCLDGAIMSYVKLAMMSGGQKYVVSVSMMYAMM